MSETINFESFPVPNTTPGVSDATPPKRTLSAQHEAIGQVVDIGGSGARISIPARVPVGTYTAETFLIRDGRVIAGAAREIRIEKLGFEGFVARAAETWSFTYGIAAVAISLLLGWGASALFQRRYG